MSVINDTQQDNNSSPGWPRYTWLIFLVLGGLLYTAISWLNPPPKPVLGPPDPARLEAMADSFAALAGRPPGKSERAQFIEQALNEELLFREALARGVHESDGAVAQRIVRNMHFLQPASEQTDEQLLADGMALNMHLTDEVIRRRLIEAMRLLLVANAELPAPSATDIEAHFQASQGQWQHPASLSFSHVYLGEIDPESAAEQLQQLRDRNADFADAAALGRPFLSGTDFEKVTWVDVSARFGPAFTRRLRRQLDSGISSGWTEVLSSTFGQHLIYLRDYQPPRDKTLEEAAPEVRRQWRQEREQIALEQAITRLRAAYSVRTS